MKKYDGRILETIKQNVGITIQEFEKIYDKDTMENQFTFLLKHGLIKMSKEGQLF